MGAAGGLRRWGESDLAIKSPKFASQCNANVASLVLGSPALIRITQTSGPVNRAMGAGIWFRASWRVADR